MNYYSSRQGRLSRSFLVDRLAHAHSYDRIAGYFSSSIIEVAGEQLEQMPGKIRMICNSELDERDVGAANAVLFMTQEWKRRVDELYSPKLRDRLTRLHDLLRSGKLEVRVLPNSAFGLIHGKAGVITDTNGEQTAFLGSANESKSAWELNYELVWEDNQPETVAWVQAEFDHLWGDHRAVPLAEAVLQDIERLSHRREVSHEKWRKEGADAGAVAVENPIYRRHFGLWPHQQYFVQRAYREHKSGRGARFVLADQVGLGKTVQLAMAAMLMALESEGPVLVIAPKTLLFQWQDELMKLLGLPTAVWTSRGWVDEQEILHKTDNPARDIRRCPRKFGIISQGLITAGSDVIRELLAVNYSCVIVDEAHRSRRSNLGPGRENEPAEPNNLMRFLSEISKCTKNMLMGTATPVQLYPIEAYDLLSVLGAGSDHVLGNDFSYWRTIDKTLSLDLIQGNRLETVDEPQKEDWVRNPFPPEEEGRMFSDIRNDLEMEATDAVIKPQELARLRPWNRRSIVEDEHFFTNHNPYVRHIIRRTRGFLETAINPETNRPYLQKVGVQLFGDDPEDAIDLPGYLKDAYNTAEEFCVSYARRERSAGFIKTLLLRRMGSSLQAGKNTAEKMLGGHWKALEEDEEETGISAKISDGEIDLLRRLMQQLNQYQAADPKLAKLQELLFAEGWLQHGCIVFSQYYDTVDYFASRIAAEQPELIVGIYAGAGKSGVYREGDFLRCTKDDLKQRVQKGELSLLFGTDAASEGLNLQRLGTLINLDLPWNPTRLEQRKGRIQRIGQRLEEVLVYNMRYRDSIEDRVHQLLSTRLRHIFDLFGQVPDVLEAVWIDAATGQIEQAKQRIRETETRSPFEVRYDTEASSSDFETCIDVVNQKDISLVLSQAW